MRLWGLNLMYVIALGLVGVLAVVWAKSIHAEHSLIFTTHAGNCFEIATIPGGVSFHYETNARDGGTFLPPFQPFPDGWSSRSMPYAVNIDVPFTRSEPKVTTHPGTTGFEISVMTGRTVRIDAPSGRWGRFGYYHVAYTLPSPFVSAPVQSEIYGLPVPLWPILLILLAACVARIYFVRRRWMRRRQNLCLVCGYSATGNASGICPECGTAVLAPLKVVA